MDRPATEAAIKVFLQEIHAQLEEAASCAKAAKICADAGNMNQAVEIALGIEQPTYEASRLLDAASLLNRLSRQ